MKPDASLCHGSVFIARSRALPYSEGGMRRLLSTLLVALALILSSLAMTSGAIANTPHAAHEAAAASSAHCAGDEMPAPGDKQPQHVSCAAACAAVPGLSPAIDAAPALSGARLIAAPTAALIGFEREGETPPPRITPVI